MNIDSDIYCDIQIQFSCQHHQLNNNLAIRHPMQYLQHHADSHSW